MKNDSLGVTIKKVRRRRGKMTQAVAAAQMGMTKRQLSKYETGAEPSAKTYQTLAKWMGCPVEVLTVLELSGSYYDTAEYKKRKRAKGRKKKKRLYGEKKRKHQYAKKYRKWLPKDQWLEMMRPKWEKMRRKKLERVNRKRENGVPLTDRERKFLQSMENA